PGVRQCRIEGPVGLNEIPAARLERIGRLPFRNFDGDAGRLPSQMEDATLRNIPNRPAAPTSVEAIIHVLIIRKIALIEQPDILKILTADYQTGAADPVSLAAVV